MKQRKINNLKLRILSLVFLLAASFYLLTSPRSASAQEFSRTITIVPPSVEVNLNPGAVTQGTLKVINDSSNPLTFSVSTQDFIVEDTKGTPTLLPPNTLNKKFSGASWIGVAPDNFTIAPHQKQILTYFIKVPLNGRPGGHYAAVVYTPTTFVNGPTTGAAVQTLIGSLFSIGVNGKIQEQASVSKFFANFFQEYGPVTISTQIKNNGDLHIKPLGVINIYDTFNREIATLPLDEHNIFPDAARDFTTLYGSNWMIGRYKASLVATYGKNNNLPLMASVYFIVFPWKVAVLVVLVIIALILLYLLRRKNSQNNQSSMNDGQPRINNQYPMINDKQSQQISGK